MGRRAVPELQNYNLQLQKSESCYPAALRWYGPASEVSVRSLEGRGPVGGPSIARLVPSLAGLVNCATRIPGTDVPRYELARLTALDPELCSTRRFSQKV